MSTDPEALLRERGEAYRAAGREIAARDEPFTSVVTEATLLGSETTQS